MSRLFQQALLFFAFFLYPNCLTSQNTSDVLNEKFSFKLKNNSCQEALDLIKEKINVRFTYNNEYLPQTRYTKKFGKTILKTVLDYLIKDADLEYVVNSDRIILRKVSEETLKNKPPPKKKKYTFNGYLKDAQSGEELIGGTISLLPNGGGSFTNEYGFFSITFPEGSYLFQFDYVGYESTQMKVDLNANQQIDVELEPIENQLTEVVVTDSKFLTENPTQSAEQVDFSNLGDFPALLGEPDVFRSLKLLPGVQEGSSSAAGLSIRGGNTDHNLVLLDEAPIYHPSHTLGLFSIFNPDVIKSVRLIKGRIPTEFRGRLSSIIDIRMDEGNNKKFGMAGGIGLLAARLKVEGKIKNGKGSFMAAGRRTYPDLIFKAFSEDFNSSDGIFFHDLNFKMNRKIGKKDRIFLSSYSGRDVFRVGENFQTVWGNSTLTLRWNHLYNEKLFSNTSLIFNDFSFKSSTDLGELANNEMPDENLLIETSVQDVHFKSIFHLYLKPDLNLKFGGNYTQHSFVPNKVIDESENIVLSRTPSRKATETSVFCAVDWEPNEKWSFNFGVHNSALFVLGDDNWIYDYDREGNLTDSTYYKKFKLIKPYFGIEPRISIIRNLKNNAEFNFSYSHTIQYLQLISSAFVNNPASVWLPSSNNIEPQKGHQINVGFHKNYPENKWKLSAEGYFSFRNKQLAFREGADFSASIDLESQLVFGKSWTAGAEFFLQKTYGRLRGWLSYTLSTSRDNFVQINKGENFRSVNDRPHNLAIIAIYDAKPHVRLSATWTIQSGKLLTVPAGKYEVNGQVVNYYESRNNYRLGTAKRLDFSILWHRVSEKGWKHNWTLAVHNLLFSRNPQFLYVDPQVGEATEITLLGFIPSFSYSFEF